MAAVIMLLVLASVVVGGARESSAPRAARGVLRRNGARFGRVGHVPDDGAVGE